MQEALLAAALQWPADGVPANPRAWLVTVATRRLTDQMRSDAARRRREEDHAEYALEAPAADAMPDDRDDSLVLLFLCCHPALATPAPDLVTTDLTAEAIRLTRALHAWLPEHGEVIGLLALEVLTEARRPARVGPGGTLVPLAEQDRSTWDATLIAEGTALITDALHRCALAPYQVQAAIAAVHVEAADTASTDWVQILGLYAVLQQTAPNPVVTLNRAVALAMVAGPEAGLRLLATLDDDERIARHHRLPAVRAHLYELAGARAAARAEYLAAARRTTSAPEKRYLENRVRGCG